MWRGVGKKIRSNAMFLSSVTVCQNCPYQDI
jgi:hypothetical protein